MNFSATLSSSPATRPLRIGIDAREMEGRPTGVGRYLRSLLRRFADVGPHHYVLYASAAVDLPVESPRFETRVLSASSPMQWEQRSLPAAARADRLDVLFCPAYSCPILSSIPRVTAIHDLSFFARPDEFGLTHGLRRRWMARFSARVSSSLLACSQFTKGEVGHYLGRDASAKTSVVLLGPDDDLPKAPDRVASRAALGIPTDATYIVTVGTILRRRNVSTLIRAMTALRESVPHLRLGVVGENRSHPFEDLEQLVHQLDLQDAVRVSGFVNDEDVARHYAAADAAVFLSEYEGFGLPALEAMSRGVPTVVADRGSLNEIFAPGALVIEPSVDVVSERLSRLLRDPQALENLRARGAERAKFFSWDKAARETLAVIEKAAS